MITEQVLGICFAIPVGLAAGIWVADAVFGVDFCAFFKRDREDS